MQQNHYRIMAGTMFNRTSGFEGSGVAMGYHKFTEPL
jgi:hypothetical protein